MTSKERAKHIFDMFYYGDDNISISPKEAAKWCALKAVDELLFEYQRMPTSINTTVIQNYYYSVKQEIGKL